MHRFMHRARFPLAVFVATLLFAADQAPPQYEMSNYVIGFLRKGPNHDNGSAEENAKIQAQHMANINRMAELGKLTVAGPFLDNGDIRGILIFKNTTLEEAKAL